MSDFKTEDRDGMRIDWDAPIPMEDGVVLRCDVYRPQDDEGKYPVIMTYGPYGKYLHFEDLYETCWTRMVEEHPDVPAGSTNKYQNWEVVDPEKWVPDGYAVVRVDSRGAGRSPGVIDIWSAREAQDFYQCIEWAAVQPWSTGKIGLNGISYYGMNQWQVGELQPPHLTAMCVWEGAADYYREMAHHGGIFCNGFARNWPEMQVYSVQHGRGRRGFKSRFTGDWVSRPSHPHRRRTRSEPKRFRRGLFFPQARHRRILAISDARFQQNPGTAPFIRQLGRTGPPPARELRGFSRNRL